MSSDERLLNLESVVIPDGVLKIGDNAFWGCDGIEELEVPSSVEEIGADAFSGIAKVYIDKTEEECEELGWTALYLGCGEIVYTS